MFERKCSFICIYAPLHTKLLTLMLARPGWNVLNAVKKKRKKARADSDAGSLGRFSKPVSISNWKENPHCTNFMWFEKFSRQPASRVFGLASQADPGAKVKEKRRIHLSNFSLSAWAYQQQKDLPNWMQKFLFSLQSFTGGDGTLSKLLPFLLYVQLTPDFRSVSLLKTSAALNWFFISPGS